MRIKPGRQRLQAGAEGGAVLGTARRGITSLSPDLLEVRLTSLKIVRSGVFQAPHSTLPTSRTPTRLLAMLRPSQTIFVQPHRSLRRLSIPSSACLSALLHPSGSIAHGRDYPNRQALVTILAASHLGSATIHGAERKKILDGTGARSGQRAHLDGVEALPAVMGDPKMGGRELQVATKEKVSPPRNRGWTTIGRRHNSAYVSQSKGLYVSALSPHLDSRCIFLIWAA